MVDAAISSRSSSASDVLKVHVAGKLVEQRVNEGTYYSTILSPAKDEFSQPEPFEVRSKRSLGSQNAMVELKCRLFGYYRKSYNVTDDRTGEVRRVRPTVVGLEVVDDF